MIIQNINSANQATTSGIRVGDSTPAVVASISQAVGSSQPSTQQLKTAVDDINQAMQQSNQNLEFSIDTTNNKPIVKVVDTQTGQLILQIPSKVAIAIAQSIGQQQQGMLLSQKA
jgi:flagellar protein FlaG